MVLPFILGISYVVKKKYAVAAQHVDRDHGKQQKAYPLQEKQRGGQLIRQQQMATLHTAIKEKPGVAFD